MKILIKKTFGVKDKDVLPLAVLIGLGFFMGIFSATYSVAGTTLFLNYFNEGSDLPGAFIISGVIGLLSAYLYSFLQKKIPFGRLIMIFSSAILLLTGGVISGFYLYEDVHQVVYLSFVLITPFITHLSLMFWGVFGRMFDVGQSRKIIGNVDTGQLVASIMALFSIPVLLTIIANVQSLILISFGSMLVFLSILLFTIAKGLLKRADADGSEKAEENKAIHKIFKNPYILTMAVFVLVSMMAVKFVDYAFLNVASAQFEDEKSMAFFLSVFEGAIVVLSFIFQTFFTDKIIENYGLRISLLITPVILLIFIILSSLIGLTLFDNYGPQSPTFLVFFIFIALGRMFSLALKDALDGPSFKLYYMPLDKSIRFDAQIKIDGVVNIFAGSVAGVFLFLFDRVSWINFLHLTFLIIPFVVLWLYIVTKMNDKYRSVLVLTLERMKKRGRKLFSKLFDTSEHSMKYLHLKNDPEIIRALEITEKVNPLFFEKLVVRYQKHRSEAVGHFLREKLALFQINYAEAKKIELRHSGNNEIRMLALEAIENSEKGDHLFLTKDQLAVLSRSEIVSDRLLVANALKFLINDGNIFLLIELLRDRDFNVKKVALKTAADIDRKETWNVIIEMLGNEQLANYAIAAIIKIGEGILPNLENHFHKSGSNLDVLSRIIRIYGQIKTGLAYEYLFKKLDYPNHFIKKETINSLKNLNSQVKGYKRTLINAALGNELGKTFWNQMALSEIPDNKYTEELAQALELEVRQNFEIIFNLLGILYDQKSVILVKENFETGTNENITFALELLNIFADEELKPLLFPVIDNLSSSERLAKLREEFPRESFNEFQSLQQIIFRESGLIGNWAKVCALYAFGNMHHDKINNTIKAQIFNEDILVRNAALWVIKKKTSGAFYEITSRLKKTNRKKWAEQLEMEFELIDGASEMPPLMTLTLQLRTFEIFSNVSPGILSHLLLSGETKDIDGREEMPCGRDFGKKVMIVLEGEVALLGTDDNRILRCATGEICTNLWSFTRNQWKKLKNNRAGAAKILLIDHHDLFKLSTTYEELMDAFALYSGEEQGSEADLETIEEKGNQ